MQILRNDKKIATRRLVIGGVLVLLLGAGVTAILLNRQRATVVSSQESSTTSQSDAPTMDANKQSDTAAIDKSGSYVTLADYTANRTKYANNRTVYFFHASWCYICQGIEKEILASEGTLPAGVTIVKVDFDTALELRETYGVSTQYTFVQVDPAGDEVAQWSAASLSDVIKGLQQ